MSGIATGTALMIGGGLAAGGSVASGLLGSSAASDAASQQANSADKAAQLQYQASQNALDFQKQQYQQSQQNFAPWLQMGGGALNQLGFLMGINPNTSLGYQSASPQGTPLLPNPSGGTSVNPAGGPALPMRPSSNMVGASPVSASGLAGSGLQLNGGPVSGASNEVPAIGAGSTLAPGMTGTVSYRPPVASPAGGMGASSPASATGAAGITAGAPSAAGGFGSLLTPYSGHFEAPTNLTEQNDPGYQARLNLGTDTLQRSAAARGNLLTGGTAKALDTYAQDYASNEYNNVYNRALTGFQTNYNQYNNDQSNIFNRLAALSGVGQSAAGQLSSAGQNASNNVSSNLLNTAGMMGQDYQNAGAANASGIIGGANAWGGALSGATGNIQNLMMLNQLGLLSGGSGGGYNVGGMPTGWGGMTF